MALKTCEVFVLVRLAYGSQNVAQETLKVTWGFQNSEMAQTPFLFI